MLTLWLIWAAMTSTVFICGIVGFFKRSPGTFVADPEKIPYLIAALGGVSAVFWVGSFVIRSKLCSTEVIRRALENYYSANPQSNKTEAADQPLSEAQKDARAMGTTPEEDAVGKALFIGFVTSWATAEAVALHGLALSHHLGQPFLYLWFAVPALASLLLGRPPAGVIRNEIRKFKAGQ